MEVIKWILAAIVGLTVTLVGVGLAIGAVIFATMLKIIGIIGFLAAAIAVTVKEKVDERNDK